MSENSIKSKIASIFERIDNKMLSTKINHMLEMINSGKNEELIKKLANVNSKEILQKLDEFDKSRLDELNINKTSLLQTINSSDIDLLSDKLGSDGKEIISKLKAILKEE